MVLKEQRRYALTVASADFGWGGSGALGRIISSYLRRWQDTQVYITGSRLGEGVLPPHSLVTRVADLRSAVSPNMQPDLHLSVLDPISAEQCKELDIPLVFVDLLPFLWGDEQRRQIPYHSTRYLRQRCAGLESVSHVVPSHAEEIQAIGDPPEHVGTLWESSSGEVDQFALILLGGLLSPQQSDRDGYVRALFPSILQDIIRSGLKEVVVLGNVSHASASRIEGLAREARIKISVGLVSSDRVAPLVRRAAIVYGQPGLGTLLDVSAAGVPFVRLPPQNVASVNQIDGFERVVGRQGSVRWPEGVYDSSLLESLRADGESIANGYFYGRINEYTKKQSWGDLVFADPLAEASKSAYSMRPEVRQSFSRLSGSSGADEVASVIRQELVKTD